MRRRNHLTERMIIVIITISRLLEVAMRTTSHTTNNGSATSCLDLGKKQWIKNKSSRWIKMYSNTLIWWLVKRRMTVPRCGHWQRNDDALIDSLVTAHKLNSQLCEWSVGFSCSRAQWGSSSVPLTKPPVATLKLIVTFVSLKATTDKGGANCRMLLKPPSL